MLQRMLTYTTITPLFLMVTLTAVLKFLICHLGHPKLQIIVRALTIDSWLFIDGELVIDLGGINGINRKSASVYLDQGPHEIDIYFAERHVDQSGLKFEMISGPRLEFMQNLCLDPEGDEDKDGILNKDDIAPLDIPASN